MNELRCEECGISGQITELLELDGYAYCGDCYQYALDELRRDVYWRSLYGKGWIYHAMPDEESPIKYYGIEIECGTESTNLEEFNRCLSELPEYFLVEEDGSIYDDESVAFGAEIISHPATYEWLIKDGKEKWDCVFDLTRNGIDSEAFSSCGMHVHISRAAFTDTHLYRFAKMIYGNDDFIFYISDRYSEGELRNWASVEYNPDDLAEWNPDEFALMTDRYTAVNMGPSDTVEIRIFHGTLEPDVFYKNIEFVESLYQFTKTTTDIEELTVENYIKYVVESKQYTYLEPILQRYQKRILVK